MTDWSEYLEKRVLAKPVGLEGPVMEVEVRQISGSMVEMGRGHQDPARNEEGLSVDYWEGDWYPMDDWEVISIVEDPSGPVIKRV